MFVNRFTYDHKAPHVHEKVIGESETIPDQSYSIEEIISRFTGGIMPTVNNRIFYDDDPDFDSIDPTMRPDYDLVDALSDMDALSRQFEARKKEDNEPALPEPPETEKAPEKELDNT
jgi:hypothetical protein